MGLEPQGGTACAYFGKIGATAAIADDGRTLAAQFSESHDWTPHEHVRGIGADVLRMAIDAAFGDVDEPAALGRREQRRDRGRGLTEIHDERNEMYRCRKREFARPVSKHAQHPLGSRITEPVPAKMQIMLSLPLAMARVM